MELCPYRVRWAEMEASHGGAVVNGIALGGIDGYSNCGKYSKQIW